jgi:DNA repair protein RecN (Recombination protein N)
VFEEVRIQGVGVIDDAVLELSPGLNVVTGETGAGKTMVVSGLGLLLGMRADASLVRAGHRAAVVEGVVNVPEGHPALERAEEGGGDVADGLLLARTVGADGRSRAHVGGRSTPVGVLSEIGETLVAVHGQADQSRLRQGDQHREVLDGFGGEAVTAALHAYRKTFDALSRAGAERDRLRQQAHERAREIDVLQAGLERIEALDPEPGEDIALRAEDERLSHADGLRLAAASAHAYLVGGGHLPLAGEDGYASDGPPPVVDALSAARAALNPMTDHDAALRELEGRVAELGYLAADLAADLASYLTDVDVDPARLAEVQQRRADLNGLTRRYGDTVDDVLAWGKEAAATLSELVGADDRVHELDAETERLRQQLGREAAALTGARQAAAEELGRRVTGELAHLAMGRAVVSVSVTSRHDPDGLPVGDRTVRWTRSGVDDVEILLASGPGSPARTVAKAASGGELSRVMLAIEVVGRTAAVPTFVFDEVDAGVGGRAALDVGARLATLARQAQVVVVTHLAQVAAFADRHLIVRKSDDGMVTSSNVEVLDGDERLQELSRMMGGDATSAVGLEHARELLDQAAALRAEGARQRR